MPTSVQFTLRVLLAMSTHNSRSHYRVPICRSLVGCDSSSYTLSFTPHKFVSSLRPFWTPSVAAPKGPPYQVHLEHLWSTYGALMNSMNSKVTLRGPTS